MRRKPGNGKILSDIGERAAIGIISKIIGNNYIGDDCAVLDMGDRYLLVTTDMVWEGSHVPSAMTPYDTGYFLVAVNLSDIASKGGMPIGIVTALGLPCSYPVESLDELVRGMSDCARKYLTEVVGGDTKECGSLTLTGTAFGFVDKDKIMLRTGARPGDMVAVTGELGGAAAGYYALNRKKKPSRAELNHFITPLVNPEPRVAEGMALAGTGAATACMDISDGLASSVHQLSEANSVGFRLELDRVPVSATAKKAAKLYSMPVDELALYFGGDYELLVTVRPEKFSAASDAVRSVGGRLTSIGCVTGKRDNILMKNGRKARLEDRGWEHFTSK
jgi:thiamine-monophosphate kinase